MLRGQYKKMCIAHAKAHISHGRFGTAYTTTLTEPEFHKVWLEANDRPEYMYYSFVQHDGYAEYTLHAES